MSILCDEMHIFLFFLFTSLCTATVSILFGLHSDRDHSYLGVTSKWNVFNCFAT